MTCTVQMVFEGSLEEEALQVLRALLFPVRTEEGCVTTALLRDLGGEPRLVWISRWMNQEAFERHLRTEHFRRLLGVVEMASEPPDILVERSVGRHGFEAIEAILAPTPAAGVGNREGGEESGETPEPPGEPDRR